MERRFEVVGPLDLRRTLRHMTLWGATTWLKVDDSGAWYARRTPEGPGTVHIRHRGDHLLATAFGDGAEHVLDDVPGLCGLEDEGIASLPDDNPRVAELKKQMRGLRQGRSGQVVPRLIVAALAQKVTKANSGPAGKRLAWQWGEQAPGPREDLRLLPEWRWLAGQPYYAFHQLGIERHRAELVKRIADRATAMQRAATMPPRQARAHLEKLRGIGPWTSGVVMGGPLGDPDAVPIGDYHLPNMVAWNLAGEPRADDRRMMELLAPYAGRRGLVARMVKGSGNGAPRWGPKKAAIDVRKM